MPSHSVPAGPFSGGGLVLGSIGLVDVSDFRHEGIVRVGVGQEGADGEQHLRDGQCGRPLVLQDVQADATIRIDVRVVNSRGKVALGRLEGVVSGEVDVQEVDTSGIGRIVGAHDGCLPVVLVLFACGAS